MANRRMLSVDLFEDEFIGTLSFIHRLVWTGLIVVCADDQGRFPNSPALIRAKVFPFDDVPLDEIARALTVLAGENKLCLYQAGGKSLGQITSWWTYQTPSWASPSKYDPPPNWRDRFKYHAAGNKILSQNWDKPGGWVAEGDQAGMLPSPLASELDSGIKEDEINDEVEGESELREEEAENGVRLSAPAAAAARKAVALSDDDMLSLFSTLTGLAAMPESTRVPVVAALRKIARRFEQREDLEAWLEECRDEWRSRRYNLTNTGWITDWALQGCIPKTKGQKEPPQPQVKRYDEGIYGEFIDNR